MINSLMTRASKKKKKIYALTNHNIQSGVSVDR